MTYIQYLHSLTTLPRPAPPLALLPKAQAASPVSDAILCAVRLAPRTYYYADGRQETRQQWSHREYPFVGFDSEFVLLRNMHGVFGRKVADVQGLPAIAEKKIA